ncbi:(2Fe-2S)-binding protein [Niveibacterium sp. SC-1]|uniref:(2Fe-2S)-binding protein n=1 Tax=Niveibacterium sp. SC-1 TaxID=3135646 RepID=UPI00311E9F46
MMRIEFELNGEPRVLETPAERRLLAILREDFGLTGAKPGCEVGRCGACMVWLDDLPTNACLVMAWQLDGRSVTTVEAIAADPRSESVRAALAECGGLQCGYCTPGLVVTMTHLADCSPRPDAACARAQLAGNLCRCTGYGGIQRAVERLFPTADAGD